MKINHIILSLVCIIILILFSYIIKKERKTEVVANNTSNVTKENNSIIKQTPEQKKFKTKILIIGSGPAGYTAAIYAARAALSPILLTGAQPGGQLIGTSDVENYPGFENNIKGPLLMEQMAAQAKKVGTNIVNDTITKVDFSQRPFLAQDSSDNIYEADAVIVSTGANALWLGLQSEQYFQGYGVSGCAVCDGSFFEDKPVVVVGGGNTAVEEAIYLTNHASKVTLIHRRDSLRADQILQKKLFSNPKVSVLWNHVLEEVVGDTNPKKVTKIRVRDIKDNKSTEIDCDGVFIAIGHKPNTNLFKEQLNIDEDGYIITQPGSTKTNIEGVFAAGDVQDKIFKQAVTAAGTGCMAALEAVKFLQSIEK